MIEMQWRDPTETEKQAIDDELRALAWTWTRRLSGLGPTDMPFSLFEVSTTPGEDTARHLAMVKTLERVSYLVQRQIEDNTVWARTDLKRKP